MRQDFRVDSIPWVTTVPGVRFSPKNGRRDTSRRAWAPSLRQTYRLTLVCHAADANAVETELRTMLNQCGLTITSLSRTPTSFAFVTIAALLASSVSERAALVRIVNDLAASSSIRRLQWEVMPNL